MSPAPALAAAAFAARSVATVIFAVLGVALAPFARVFLEKVTFGTGPRLFTARVGATVIAIHALPILSSLTPFGANPYPRSESDGPAPSLPPSRVPWLEASPWRRVLAFVVAPRLAALAIAAAIVGPACAGRAAVDGVVDLVAGAFGPFSTAPALLDAGAALFVREGFVALAAVVLCKWLSIGLLSLPSDLAFAAATKHGDRLGKARIAVMLITLFVYASWIVAWVGWMRR